MFFEGEGLASVVGERQLVGGEARARVEGKVLVKCGSAKYEATVKAIGKIFPSPSP